MFKQLDLQKVNGNKKKVFLNLGVDMQLMAI